MSRSDYVGVPITPVPQFETADLVDVAKQVQDRSIVVAQFSLNAESKLGALYTLRRSLGKIGLRANSLSITNLAWPQNHVMPIHTDATPYGAVSTHFTTAGHYKALIVDGSYAQKSEILTDEPAMQLQYTDTELVLPADDAARVSSAWVANGGPQTLLLFTESAHQFTTTNGPRRSMALYYTPKV